MSTPSCVLREACCPNCQLQVLQLASIQFVPKDYSNSLLAETVYCSACCCDHASPPCTLQVLAPFQSVQEAV